MGFFEDISGPEFAALYLQFDALCERMVIARDSGVGMTLTNAEVIVTAIYKFDLEIKDPYSNTRWNSIDLIPALHSYFPHASQRGVLFHVAKHPDVVLDRDYDPKLGVAPEPVDEVETYTAPEKPLLVRLAEEFEWCRVRMGELQAQIQAEVTAKLLDSPGT